MGSFGTLSVHTKTSTDERPPLLPVRRIRPDRRHQALARRKTVRVGRAFCCRRVPYAGGYGAFVRRNCNRPRSRRGAGLAAVVGVRGFACAKRKKGYWLEGWKVTG